MFGIDDMSKADYSGITSFWRREIDNEDIQSILHEAFNDLDINSVQTCTRPIPIKIPTLSGRCWGAPMAMESSTS
jgi:hypothetical protein